MEEVPPPVSSSRPPPQPPKESLVQRYKVAWRLLLISNLALGAYMFVRARKKDTTAEDSKAAAKVPSTPVVTPATPVPEEPALPPPIAVPVKVREPIPEDQQLELFKWILEEKRKVKPKGREEKKRIDEEKALLKQFIRAKSIPNI
ncbi:uncharacterized protein LOC114289484 [Camellia sinensis]|uniref:uncharacterized protein LOC114289484 n=1 Tax=Camellia sinensis TaxID=4442 RepID=UPI00103618E8|nr:uncharacterized protein LOC114289484 [Camellia sinensis]